jgi:hypothetical protein
VGSALRRCPTIAVPSLRRLGRLAPHPPATASISQFILSEYLTFIITKEKEKWIILRAWNLLSVAHPVITSD